MPPHFRPSPALLNWEKNALRWPGPFGFGFLSPQPPGIVGIGPNAAKSGGHRQVGPFSFDPFARPLRFNDARHREPRFSHLQLPALRLSAHSGVKNDGP